MSQAFSAYVLSQFWWYALILIIFSLPLLEEINKIFSMECTESKTRKAFFFFEKKEDAFWHKFMFVLSLLAVVIMAFYSGKVSIYKFDSNTPDKYIVLAITAEVACLPLYNVFFRVRKKAYVWLSYLIALRNTAFMLVYSAILFFDQRYLFLMIYVACFVVPYFVWAIYVPLLDQKIFAPEEQKKRIVVTKNEKKESGNRPEKARKKKIRLFGKDYYDKYLDGISPDPINDPIRLFKDWD